MVLVKAHYTPYDTRGPMVALMSLYANEQVVRIVVRRYIFAAVPFGNSAQEQPHASDGRPFEPRRRDRDHLQNRSNDQAGQASIAV